ncbi:hypothetical protein F66182_1092 [Fusarium sp. NRRL 66182]|nr:hypothetical protein F66182_1092 [Fusarium sp. NRRL 66182]
MGAGGTKSTTRSLLTGQADKPRNTGDVAYRTSFEDTKLRVDPDLASLLHDSYVTVWGSQLCEKDELCKRFASWESRIKKLCQLSDDILKWRLCDLPDITTCVHASG